MSLNPEIAQVARDINHDVHKGIQTYNKSVIIKVLDAADNAYHEHGHPILTDTVYDILRDKYPRTSVGYEVVDGHNKIKLPYWLGSMNKRTMDVKIDKPTVISDKLDGVSGLLVVTNKGAQMLTRGNGSVGRDISHVIPDVNIVLPTNPMVVRGELVMARSVFNNLKNGESNARNTVAGFVNSKQTNSNLRKKIDFVAYEVLEPANLKPSKQMELLTENSLMCVRYDTYSQASDQSLTKLLKERDTTSKYDMDGLIVAYDVKYTPVTKKNPTHAFAFKLNASEQLSCETEVTHVSWKLSKDGFLKPTVHMKPIQLKGVSIKKATGNNAKFIVDNGIGVGAKIRIIRSGDVIPRIIQVISKSIPDMPKEPYVWNESNVDILNKSTDVSKLHENQLIHTIAKLKFPNLGDKNIQTIYAHGFDSLGKILKLNKESIKSIDKLKGKLGDKIIDSISQRREELKCIDYAVASNIFGRGLSINTLTSINSIHPFLSDNPTVDQLKSINGIGEIMANQYVVGLPKFRKYVRDNGVEDICLEKSKSSTPTVVRHTSDLMKGKIILFTGFRDATLESQIINAGGTISTTLTKKVNMLIFADDKDMKSNKKFSDAKARGDVEICSRSVVESMLLTKKPIS